MDIGNFRKKSDLDEEVWEGWLGTEAQEKKTSKALPISHSPVKKNRIGENRAHKSSGTGAQLKLTARGVRGTRPPTSTKQSTRDAQPVVSIQINMPRFRIPWRRLRTWLMSGAIVAVLLVAGKWTQTALYNDKPKEKQAPVVAAADLGYKPLVPPSTVENQQGVPKPSYDPQKQLYTFNDIYKGSNLTVSQQAVPSRLKNNPGEVRKFAQNVGTNDEFSTTRGIVYIVTSENSGAQRLILVTDKMLMFLQSTKEISVVDWTTYVQNLE